GGGHDPGPMGPARSRLRRQLRADQNSHRARAHSYFRTSFRGSVSGVELAPALRGELEPRRAEMVALLRRLVEIESPSDDPAGLDAFAAELRSLFGELGSLEALPGRNLRLAVDGHSDGEHAVALCHYDTVWSKGTLQKIPFSVDAGGVARGPGCFDMKGGIVELYFALQALRARGLRPKRLLHVLFTSDEEVGSPGSRGLIEETARGAALAYVLESPLPGGTLKTARKG